jgi:hypothetical protein
MIFIRVVKYSMTYNMFLERYFKTRKMTFRSCVVEYPERIRALFCFDNARIKLPNAYISSYTLYLI